MVSLHAAVCRARFVFWRMLSKEHAQRTPRENVCACAGTKNGEHFKLGLNGFNVACVTGSMLEIEPATEVDE